MLTTRVRVQVLAFVVVALSAVAFIGGKYAGLGQLFGGSGYVVSLRLADGGGVFTNGEVTYRGVAVGRVGELRLTDEGMEVDLRIDGSAPPIPVNSAAVVSNRSAVGEQYVDLQPRTGDGPFLEDGSSIPMESARVPLPVQDLLANLSSLNASVPTDALRTVVDEFYDAFHGAGPDLQVLLDSSTAFTKTAAAHLPQTQELLTDGTTVLQTQLDSSDAWKSFSSNAKLFAGELASADGDLRALIGTAPQAATQISGLLEDTDPSLSILLANLLTTADVFATRTAGMEELFATIPKAVAATSTSIDPVSGDLSIVTKLVDPPVCKQGYEGTQRRTPLELAPLPMNTEAACTLPKGSASSVRGSQNAPKGGVPPVAVPGSALPGPLSTPSLPQVSTDMEDLLWLPN
ncbi:MCE family protein [Amycolatopsis albispora]|uniref:ABC transporter substrate-binding protein n=1 Tax=Amycolatopsis albispora TaxID=1804986 RepID=A0A344L8F4_9PSEU|nr:MlaD family protein [Amycolatopsis albispora]AXB44328.1 ABC transporter substrate-binding protein [Amycolatopsis albispora]